ncbi:MAG: hypothetical protein Q8O08_04230 [Methyloversatilis sp.]|nr:hypothetical protein [Methyloversatilis sp.]MDP2868011.1 hypothetical protein [Methyloversatilis sp.]MDP3454946.1 hypothetical protein [Methyloversatilis sp.]MDP3576914.1 hypothetical protein [Methyloversatilis sp.]
MFDVTWPRHSRMPSESELGAMVGVGRVTGAEALADP